MATESLFLTIRTPQEVIYKAEVMAVTSINGKGRFDILPEHAHFISIIEKEIVISERSLQKKRIGIELGIIHVEDNKVSVYLEGQAKS